MRTSRLPEARALALALLVTSAASAAGLETAPLVAPTRVATRATPEQVQLGQPFVYELLLTHPPEHRYELRAPADTGVFALQEQERRREDGQASATTTFRLKMALFELGAHPLPPLTFEVATPEGLRRYVAEGPTVTGLSALPADADVQGAQLKDFKAAEDVPVRSWRLLWALAGLVALGLAAWALWRWLKRPRPAASPARPLLPLDVRTRKALDALGAERLPEQGRQKEFYSRLTDILRDYLGERFGVEARESTTHELLSSLSRTHVPRLPAEQLRTLLEEADLVKFAKMEVDVTACEAALAFGHQLVSLTWQPPAPPPSTTPPPPHRPDAPRPELP